MGWFIPNLSVLSMSSFVAVPFSRHMIAYKPHNDLENEILVKARSYLVNEWHEECVRDEARDVLGRCYLCLSSFRHKYQLSSKLRKKLTFPTSSRERTCTVKGVFRRLECGDELHELHHRDGVEEV